MIVQIRNQNLHLHYDRAVFWVEAHTLLIADLHLGKADHFRKQGIAAPTAVRYANFERLENLLVLFGPEKVIFLGDLFHSTLNSAWQDLARMMAENPEIQFELVKGNHDILPKGLYDLSLMTIHDPPLSLSPFLLTHYPLTPADQGLYNLSGHLHPGVRLEGRGKQSLRLPCFHFSKSCGVLPAFGAFTGLSMIKAQKSDRIFVIADDEVLEV